MTTLVIMLGYTKEMGEQLDCAGRDPPTVSWKHRRLHHKLNGETTMTIEYLAEKIFLSEIETSQEVWVARSIYKNIYTEEFDANGLSLPVWSSRDKVLGYLQQARLVGPKYEPHAVALEVFTKAWLSDQSMGIAELLINPDGRSSRMLALTSEEFQASQGH